MRLAVIPLHEADGPFSQVDGGSLGRLYKRVSVLHHIYVSLFSHFSSSLPHSSPFHGWQTYKQFLRCGAFIGDLAQTLLNHVLQDGGEGIALGKLRRRLVHDLL